MQTLAGTSHRLVAPFAGDKTSLLGSESRFRMNQTRQAVPAPEIVVSACTPKRYVSRAFSTTCLPYAEPKWPLVCP